MGVGGWRAAPLRVGSPAHPRNSPEQISGDPEAERNACARCSGPPCTTRQLQTTPRVQGPTLRDAALANDTDGSPPVARGPSPPPLADYTDRATARLFRIAASVRGGKTRLRPATRIPTAQTALGDQVPGTGN